ncbi:MAG: hypothetical protein A3E84_04765 [Gammaproteobacteria bacterium RIFCSPHIGHO2_12_FULL_42_13]|nr:MAG: hypothetical protein A3E84_04765 [Gammaproteobacteria bacterium RIFCSPHIGHO2_12_FULL_42_13]
MKIDTHTHFLPKKNSAPDWKIIQFYFQVARHHDLNVICFTEHLDADFYENVLNSIFEENCFSGEILNDGLIRLPNSLLLSSGTEISLAGGADVGLHAKPSVIKKLNKTKGFYTLDFLAEELETLDSNYILVAHHLFRTGKWIDNIDKKSALIDAIELPPKDITQESKYRELSLETGKPFVAGSDSHTWLQLGVGATYVDELNFDGNNFNLKEFKQLINRKMVEPVVSSDALSQVELSTLYRMEFLA